MPVAIVGNGKKLRSACTVRACWSCNARKVIAWRFVYGGHVHLDQNILIIIEIHLARGARLVARLV